MNVHAHFKQGMKKCNRTNLTSKSITNFWGVETNPAIFTIKLFMSHLYHILPNAVLKDNGQDPFPYQQSPVFPLLILPRHLGKSLEYSINMKSIN